jgi:hypothetical protein
MSRAQRAIEADEPGEFLRTNTDGFPEDPPQVPLAHAQVRGHGVNTGACQPLGRVEHQAVGSRDHGAGGDCAFQHLGSLAREARCGELIQESLRRGAAPELIELNDLTCDCIRGNAKDCLGSTRVKSCHDSPLARTDEFSTYPALRAEGMHIQTITSRRPETDDNLDCWSGNGYTRQVAIVVIHKKRGDSASGRCLRRDAIQMR